jgi:hypothetical protein
VSAGAADTGTVLAVRSSVVDARFEHRLPPILNALRCGEDGRNCGGDDRRHPALPQEGRREAV